MVLQTSHRALSGPVTHTCIFSFNIMFSTVLYTNFALLAKFRLSSEYALNLHMSKILWFGKE